MDGNSRKQKVLTVLTSIQIKPGKVSIPNHPGDLDPRTIKSILKQAGL